MRLVLASSNPHKLRELTTLLAPHELAPLPTEVELPPETGTTFAENALIKARAAAGATGEAAGAGGDARGLPDGGRAAQTAWGGRRLSRVRHVTRARLAAAAGAPGRAVGPAAQVPPKARAAAVSVASNSLLIALKLAAGVVTG